jgi:predicted membrane-bound spermidine synthase
MKAKAILRWTAIAGFGGYGGYTIVHGIGYALSRQEVHRAAFWFFPLPFLLLYGGLSLAVAYFILRKEYRHLCTLVSALIALVVFEILIVVPGRLGLHERVTRWGDSDAPWTTFLALPLLIAMLLVPFFAARWAYRRGQAFLLRFINDDAGNPIQNRP